MFIDFSVLPGPSQWPVGALEIRSKFVHLPRILIVVAVLSLLSTGGGHGLSNLQLKSSKASSHMNSSDGGWQGCTKLS